MKENKASFIIVRVTESEKEYLKKQAKKFGKKFSTYIRVALGLGK